MSPVTLNEFTIPQGADYTKRVRWASKVNDVTTPIDLTGCSARMQAREHIDDTATVFDMTTLNGLIVLGGTSGDIDLVFPAASTVGKIWTRAVYDLEITLADGNIRRLFQGRIRLSQEVTRDS